MTFVLQPPRGHRGDGSGASPVSHRLPLLRLPIIPHLLRQYEELAGTSAERQPLVHRPVEASTKRPAGSPDPPGGPWPASSSRASTPCPRLLARALDFTRERPPTPGTRGRQAVSTRFGMSPGAPVVPGLEGSWPKGGLPSTTSEPAVLGKLAEAMANACLHSLNTQSALPTPASRRCCAPVFRQAGYRASFINLHGMARAGPSRSIGPLPGGSLGFFTIIGH